MIRRFALVSAMVAFLAALSVLSMHAVDAHPMSAIGAPTTLAHESTPPAAHEPHGAPARYGATGPAMAESATALVGLPPTGDADTSDQGHGGQGHGGGSEHHMAMCAAVVLAGLTGALFLGTRSRMSPGAVRRLIGTALRIDPPVPRLVLAHI